MIKLVKGYYIDVDGLSYTLMLDNGKKRTDKKTGEEVDVCKVISYHTSLENAIKGCIKDLNKRDLSEGVFELNEAVKIVKDNNELMQKLLTKHLGGA